MQKLKIIHYKNHDLPVWNFPGPWQVDIPDVVTYGAHWADRNGVRSTTTFYCDTLPVLRRVCALTEQGKYDKAATLLAANQKNVSRVLTGLSHIDFA